MSYKNIQKIGTMTATALVVANMIGTGAFTSLGFQLQDISHPWAIICLWLLGGLLALSGAYSYAEIGTVIKKSGGEYTFLTDIYNPLLGYLAGWVSLTVGFAAPVALSAIAVVEYFPFLSLNPACTGVLIVGVITAIHSLNLQSSSKFQNITTLLKLAIIISLIAVGLIVPTDIHWATESSSVGTDILSPAFAIALIYVSYSYSGWNAAVYIIDEIENPKKSLAVALVGGTVIVTVIYTLLQFVFLKHVAISELVGKVNVGTMAAQKMLGENMGNIFSMAISILLISGISAMVWVGPRVTSSMAKDYKLWQFFKTSENGIPSRALWLQFAITAVMLLTGTFEQILIYCGFLLTASSMLTVMGIFIIRKKHAKQYAHNEVFKSPLFPLFQIIFILFSLGMITFAFIDKPMEALLGTSNLLLGWLTWYIDKNIKT